MHGEIFGFYSQGPRKSMEGIELGVYLSGVFKTSLEHEVENRQQEDKRGSPEARQEMMAVRIRRWCKQGIFGSCGCCHLSDFETKEIYSLTILQAKSPKSVSLGQN